MEPTGPAGLARGDPSSALRELSRGPEAGSTGGGVHRANASCGISLEHASAGAVVAVRGWLRHQVPLARGVEGGDEQESGLRVELAIGLSSEEAAEHDGFRSDTPPGLDECGEFVAIGFRRTQRDGIVRDERPGARSRTAALVCSSTGRW